jgi:hypothetical protein
MDEFFMVFVEGETTPTYKHERQEKAKKEAERLANKLGKKAYIMRPMGFSKPEIKVDSYESACKYLGRENDYAICGCDNKHHKAMVSLFKLVTIAEAWNKQDDFVPDFSNRNQYKYFTWFQYNDNAAGFVCADANNTATGATAYFGSRLCFKTESRAREFGVQFIDLWNDFLLFK